MVKDSIQKVLRGKKVKRYIRLTRKSAARLCKISAKFVGPYNEVYRRWTARTLFQSHHVFQNSVMKSLLGNQYRYGIGFVVPLLGGSHLIGSPHYNANLAQRNMAGSGAAPSQVARTALQAAGCKNEDVDKIMTAAQNYNQMQGWIVP